MTWNSFFVLLCFVLGLFLAALKDYSWFCTQGSFLSSLEDHMGCWETNLAEPHMQGKCSNHCTISLDPRDLNLLHIVSNSVDFLLYQVKHLPIFKLFPWNEQLMEPLFLYVKFCWIPEIYSMCKQRLDKDLGLFFGDTSINIQGTRRRGLPSIFSQVCQQLKGLGIW